MCIQTCICNPTTTEDEGKCFGHYSCETLWGLLALRFIAFCVVVLCAHWLEPSSLALQLRCWDFSSNNGFRGLGCLCCSCSEHAGIWVLSTRLMYRAHVCLHGRADATSADASVLWMQFPAKEIGLKERADRVIHIYFLKCKLLGLLFLLVL